VIGFNCAVYEVFYQGVSNFKTFFINMRCSNRNQIIPVDWKPPTFSWIKCNTNSETKRSLGPEDIFSTKVYNWLA